MMPSEFSEPRKIHFLSAVSSYVLWGLIPIFFKLLSDYGVFQIVLFRFCLSSLVFLGIFFWNRSEYLSKIRELRKKSPQDFQRMIALTFLGGVLMFSNSFAYLYVVNKVSVGTAAFAYLTLPILTAFLARIILKELLTPNKWVAILISTLACYMISTTGFDQLFYVLIISGSYAIYLITQRKNTYLDRIPNLCFQFCVTSLILLLMSFSSYFPDSYEVDSFFLGIEMLIVIFFTVVPAILSLFALSKIPSSQLSFLAYCNPILSFFLSVLVYKEPLEGKKLVAYTLLGLSSILFNLQFNRKK